MISRQLLIDNFQRSFTFKGNEVKRGIGIECEMPVVTNAGNAPTPSTIQRMFRYLETKGFELELDEYSGLYITATRKNESTEFEYATDTITTDVGYSILEIVLPPENNLHSIKRKVDQLLFILIPFFKTEDCQILGYGIQPFSSPSKKLLMPQERYCFFEKLSSNKTIPESEGNDAAFLTITASNQCHIEIGIEETIPVTNMLNALSGLQIAFHANSPIWKGKIKGKYKANREVLWNYSFPDRQNQMGIPPQFESLQTYIDYILTFKPLLVKREEQFLQIVNKETFSDYLNDKSPTIGSSISGNDSIITPTPKDMEELYPFVWFNARLCPKYGTIESRMCCQQPPRETLTSTALTLGLIANKDAAIQLASKLPIQTWQEIHTEASKHVFAGKINGESIIPLLQELLDISNKGLLKRNLGEEVFLRPLYKRLEQRKSPACLALEIYENEGKCSFLNHFSFKIEDLISCQ